MEETTKVYTFEGKFNLTEGQGSLSENILMTKHSVNVSGVTSYQGIGKNVTIIFGKDGDIPDEDNTAQEYTFTKSDTDGLYTIELTPGSYNISVYSDEFSENGNRFTYEWDGKLTVTEADISTGKILNIDELEKAPVAL